jgi:3-hydroxyacyl-CoA dehydrogenase
MSKSVAVVGAGLVGRGWAIVFARAAPGGIRDYVQRFGQPYYEIAVEQAQPRRWHDALITKVEQERRKMLSADQLQARQRWRDLYLMSIVASKNSRTG